MREHSKQNVPSTTREHQRKHKERNATPCHPSTSTIVPRPILASSHIMPVTSRSRPQAETEAGGAHLASLIEFFESQACEQAEREGDTFSRTSRCAGVPTQRATLTKGDESIKCGAPQVPPPRPPGSLLAEIRGSESDLWKGAVSEALPEAPRPPRPRSRSTFRSQRWV